MSEETRTTEEYIAEYLREVLGGRTAEAVSLDGRQLVTYGAGQVGPEFWADAPWRLEPDQDAIPFTFIIRDGAGESVKVRLEEIGVYETPDDGTPLGKKKEEDWRLVRRFVGADSGPIGPITAKLWTYRVPPAAPFGSMPRIPLKDFQTICEAANGACVPVRGQRLLLKVVFRGSWLQGIVTGRRPFTHWQPLVIYLAKDSLPLHKSSQWYYGDTHYHSSYTNDIKEFGNPVLDTRAAGLCIGLDWLIVTDHSVDLADENPYWQDDVTRPDDRWDALGREVQVSSNRRFRILRGEEVTVKGRQSEGDDTLHMLAFGTRFDRLIPGAFYDLGLLGVVADLLLKGGFAEDVYRHLFGPVYGLKAVLTGRDESGQEVRPLKGRSIKTQGALAFAAHPKSMAQFPGSEWGSEDLDQRLICGMESWNGRERRLTGQEQCPFDHWQASDSWAGSNKNGVEAWDEMLQKKVGSGDFRFVLLGGSDAHGSFNYSLNYSPRYMLQGYPVLAASDNALGKVRTLLYLPERESDGKRRAPTQREVVKAIREGSCVVTDGPVLNFTLGFDGHEARLGEMLTVTGGGKLNVNIEAGWTDEFGPVKKVNVVYYFQGMRGSKARRVPFRLGYSSTIARDLPPGSGYVRLETETEKGGETYRCVTNPIWVKSEGTGARELCVNCTGRLV